MIQTVNVTLDVTTNMIGWSETCDMMANMIGWNVTLDVTANMIGCNHAYNIQHNIVVLSCTTASSVFSVIYKLQLYSVMKLHVEIGIMKCIEY